VSTKGFVCLKIQMLQAAGASHWTWTK